MLQPGKMSPTHHERNRKAYEVHRDNKKKNGDIWIQCIDDANNILKH
jgi:hypothetical protein